MSNGQLKNKVKAIKNAIEFDFEARAAKQAIERHELRYRTIRQLSITQMAADLMSKDGGEPLDYSDPAYRAETMAPFDDLASELGKDRLKQWRDDQRTIENHYRRAYGNIDKFIKCNAFGATPEEMSEHFGCQYLQGVHDNLSKKEQRKLRKETRREMKKASIEPLKLHPATGDQKGKFSTRRL